MIRSTLSASARFGVAAALSLTMVGVTAAQQAPAPAQPRPAQGQQQPAQGQQQPAQGQRPAQPAQPAQPQAQNEQLAAVQSPWVKLCEQVPTDERQPPTMRRLCMTVQETRAENGQMLASLQVRELEGERPRLIIAVPIGMSLRPGIRVVLDQGQAQAMTYEVCMPNACFAQMEVQPDFVNRMKRANNLNIQVVNMNNRAISLAMNLSGFAASYDGAPVDPQQYEASQRRLAEELQRRAEEQQRRLQQQQQQAPTPVPAVPGAPLPVPQMPR